MTKAENRGITINVYVHASGGSAMGVGEKEPGGMWAGRKAILGLLHQPFPAHTLKQFGVCAALPPT